MATPPQSALGGHFYSPSHSQRSFSSLSVAILIACTTLALFILWSQPRPACRIILTGESISILDCEHPELILPLLPKQPLIAPLSLTETRNQLCQQEKLCSRL
uniref:Movement protein TGBp3 n=1 Tax=Agave potexvirus 1 TaxID=2794411 RepID=A0A7T5QZC2_9VIRU|nr:TGB3 [Agave potexvirus 1]